MAHVDLFAVASVQSQYGDGAAPDSLRASPSRGLPTKEPYYSNRGKAVDHPFTRTLQLIV